MFKKIIIPSLAFLGMAWMAFYTSKLEDQNTAQSKKNENSLNAPYMVLELFTSQGCSSCPPADALLERVKNEFPEEIYVLSYHVDYWDYIGWKDPFSKSVYSRKQRSYNRKFGYQGNYTPELVVNGKEHFVGSDRSRLYSKIGAYKRIALENQVKLSNIKTTGKTISFKYSVDGKLENKQLRAVLVLDEKTTQVSRGENRNRTLHNSNIVVMETYASLQNSKGNASIEIPAIVTEDDRITLMAIIEADNLDITGADKFSIR